MVRLLIFFFLFSFSLFSYSFAWYNDMGEGWYYYTNDTERDNNSSFQRPHIPNKKELMIMPTRQFKDLFDNVTDYALTYRTLDTFKDYEIMRQVAMERSLEFASLQQLYNQLNPVDTSTVEDPSLHSSYLTEQIRSYLSNHKSEYGLIYFYGKNCVYCKKQSPLIDLFVERSNWVVEMVEISEKPKLAAYFGVTTTPTLFIFDRNNQETYQVTSGYVRLDELENRLYKYIRYIKGESSELNYDSYLDGGVR